MEEDSLQSLTSASGFSFQGMPIDDVLDQSSTITLAVFDVDRSGSTSGYSADLEKAVGLSIDTCKKSPFAEALLARCLTFDSTIEEIHGFKALDTLDKDSYKGKFNARGATLLYDSVMEAIDTAVTYGEALVAKDCIVNIVIFVVTDGGDAGSRLATPEKIKARLEQVRRDEKIKEIRVILVGMGDQTSTDQYLKDFSQRASISQYEWIGTATPQTMAKLTGFVSGSISASSQAIAAGHPSQAISF